MLHKLHVWQGHIADKPQSNHSCAYDKILHGRRLHILWGWQLMLAGC